MENLNYNSIWLSLKNKPYKSISELKGKPVAFASRSSTSGFLIPTWDLAKQGCRPRAALTDFFSQTVYGSGMFLQSKKSSAVKLKRPRSAIMFSKETINIYPTNKKELKIFRTRSCSRPHSMYSRGISQNDRISGESIFVNER